MLKSILFWKTACKENCQPEESFHRINRWVLLYKDNDMWQEYSTDKFLKHILFWMFIHESDACVSKYCQIFLVMA